MKIVGAAVMRSKLVPNPAVLKFQQYCTGGRVSCKKCYCIRVVNTMNLNVSKYVLLIPFLKCAIYWV
jgi:hypothetical protein